MHQEAAYRLSHRVRIWGRGGTLPWPTYRPNLHLVEIVVLVVRFHLEIYLRCPSPASNHTDCVLFGAAT